MNQYETWNLYCKGKDAWNAWANEMLAKRNELDQSGKWAAARNASGILEGKNDETMNWITNANVRIELFQTMFTQNDLSELIFPNDIFISGTDSGSLKLSNKDIFGCIRSELGFPTCVVDFTAATFLTDFTLIGRCIYPSFNGARFLKTANFDKAEWLAEFKSAHFYGEARFAGAKFPNGAHFERAQFDDTAVFEGTTFENYVNFDGAVFKSSADFRARFNRAKACFRGTRFSQVRFDNVNFERGAEFENAQFSGDADFAQAKFGGHATFQKTRFRKAATFTDIEARGGFSFVDATFSKLPRINGAHFEKLPLLDGMKFKGSAEPGGLLRSIFRKVKEDVPICYRELKNYAIKAGHMRNEQTFFRGELRSRRNREDKFWHPAFWLGIGYELFSDLGKSLSRPVAWWLALTAASAWLYLQPLKSAGATACIAGKGDPVMSALLLALKKGVILGGLDGAGKDSQIYACLYGLTEGFGSAHGVKDLVPALPDWVAMYGFLQTAFSAALLFLFLLALRNHFRIR